MRISALVAAACAGVAAGQPLATGPAVRYDGYKVVRVELETSRDLRTMLSLGADMWSHHVQPGDWADFMVAPEVFDALEATDLRYEVVKENVQAAVDAENARLRAGGARGWFDDFRTLDEINDYLDMLAAGHPGLAEVVDLGDSLEGRPIRGLRIANDASGSASCKPTVLYNACQHAREWISPMVAMYTADRLLNEYATDPAIADLIDATEIMIVPISNPDGYVYTWTTDRYWRKNRRNNGGGEWGVDLNRNWGFAWGNNNGSSGWPGSDLYRGSAPFSEPETQRLRDWSLSRPRMGAQADIHSYGQYILWPWGYTRNSPPEAPTLSALGSELRQQIQAVHGRSYSAGQAYTLLYPVSGGAMDWFLGELATVNYTFELRGWDFVIPPSEIIPNSEEMYPALVRLAEWALENRGAPSDFNRDGASDTLDVLAFLNAWSAGDPRADFDNSGTIDTLDVLGFLNAWSGGC